MTDEDQPDENPLEAVGREFSEVCASGGTEVALAHLIALQQRQHARMRVMLVFTDPSASSPPAGTHPEAIAVQEELVEALKTAEIRMRECEFWIMQAARCRAFMASILARNPTREDVGGGQ